MRVTGSKLALLEECGWWARYEAEWQTHTSSEASFGTQLHAMCEAFINGKALAEPVDGKVADVFCTHVAPWLQANKRASWRAEIPFAIDVVEGAARELEKGEHRDYSSAKPGELCLTTDVCYMASDDDGPFACVDDFKWSGFHGDAEKAKAQLTGQALAVSLVWGVDRVRARAIRISEAGIDDTSEVYWLNIFELEGARSDIADLLATIPAAQPKPGEHCKGRWCPALASCPATTSLVAQVIPADALARKEWKFSPTIESPDHLERLLAMLPIAVEFVDRVKKATVAYVADGPVRTSDGREIKQGTRDMPRLNTKALEALAKQLGATDDQLAMCWRINKESSGVKVSAKKGKAA